MSRRLLEEIEIVTAFPPSDLNTDANGDWVSLKNYDGCLVWWKAFGPNLVEAAKASDGFVAPWIVPPDKVREFADAGVDALVVDDPAETLKRLGDRS